MTVVQIMATLMLIVDNTYVFQMQQCNGIRTVHGLWPQWGEWCAGPPFSSKAIEPLAPELAKYWPSCAGGDNATQFHEHEWLKHGTCAGTSEFDYFSAALALRNVYANSTDLRICLDSEFNRIDCPTDVADRRGFTTTR